MRLKKASIGLFVILLLSTVGINQVSGDFSVVVTINDAWYEDSDADETEDDIVVLLTLELFNHKMMTNVDLYLGIELPSGVEHWFLAEMKLMKTGSYGYIDLKFTLLNTAYESGWYWAHGIGFASGEQYSTMDSLLFDPPGGSLGGSLEGFWETY